MFESIPTYPDAARYWELVERLGITIFYTAPTAIRALHAQGDDFVARADPLEPAPARHGGRADQPGGMDPSVVEAIKRGFEGR